MDSIIWITVGLLIMFAGGIAVKNRRFAASRADYIPLSKEDLAKTKGKRFGFFHYEGRPAIVLGLFFFLLGLAIVVNTLLSYLAQ